jgi:hypothetical protein
MQVFALDFLPARRPSLRIVDGLPAATHPHPHVIVGEAAATAQVARIPMTPRLAAIAREGNATVGRAGVYRDPKTGRIVLGIESSTDRTDTRALVLLAASSSFPDGVSVIPEKTVGVIAQGDVRNGRQYLFTWPDGAQVVIEEPAREARYAIRRSGDQFESVPLADAR